MPRKRTGYDAACYYDGKLLGRCTKADSDAYTLLMNACGGDAARVLREYAYFSPELKAILEKAALMQADRSRTGGMFHAPKSSPWGEVQSCETLCPGVFLVSTASHGGTMVANEVECQNNQLTSLILGENKMLKKLNCANNQLTQLNLNNMISLKELNCFNNQLTVLDVSSSPELTKLWLGNNHLTSLNLDNNPNLNFTYTDIYSGENVYTVTLNPDRTFDLRNLPGNFDINRVTGWVHGDAEGNTLTVDEGTNVVYYGYTCRSGMLEVSFKLDVTGTGGSTGGGSTGGGSTGGGTVPPVTPPSGGSTGGGSGGSDGGAGIAVLAIGGAAVAGLVGYSVYNHVAAQKLRALLPPDVSLPENRAKTALLLWDTAGRPEPAEAPAFADVADPDTAKAAQWCVEQGLMKRRLNGRFGPDGTVPAYRILNAYRQLTG